MIRFASLGSGSKGNATLVEAGCKDSDTRILLDCGFSVKETESRLANLGRTAESITAILITHEHSDHVIGAGRLSRKYKIPVWLTVGTFLACKDNAFHSTYFIDSHNDFEIEELLLHPFPVPHDAREPCQFVFSDGKSKLGVVTDLGCYTPHIIRHLNNVDGLLLESNYDQQMLQNGTYPRMLKDRVLGRVGHLDNLQASELLKKLNLPQLKHLVGMHISEKNNHPEYALKALSSGMGCSQKDISLATQSSGFDWRELA